MLLYFHLRTAAKEPTSVSLLFSSRPDSGETRPSSLWPRLTALPERGGHAACSPSPRDTPSLSGICSFSTKGHRVTSALALLLAVPQAEGAEGGDAKAFTEAWEPSASEHSSEGVSWAWRNPAYLQGRLLISQSVEGPRSVRGQPLPPLRPRACRTCFSLGGLCI